MTPRHFLSASLILLTGCTGAQSALNPAGKEAQRIADLFWVMTAGAGVVWLSVMLLAFHAAKQRPAGDRARKGDWIIFGGAAAPAVVLAILLAFGLAMLPDLLAVAPKDALRIHVHGEQWWWRFRYEVPGRPPFETANEIRLPVGEPVEFLLHSSNVIHSFWIPSLGGKMDMMPGRVNRLVLHPNRTGTFRGTCAEYCGTGHAKMAFEAIVLPKDDFQKWLDATEGAAKP
ncbi:MAG: cytochrome c oxidase subunit II [Bryobacteraceae bacterium]